MTKEQIKEIVCAALKLHGETSSTFDYRDIVERIGPEIIEAATAAERERLMELVCASCGRSTVGGYVMCDVDSCDGDGMRFVTRAEYERKEGLG